MKEWEKRIEEEEMIGRRRRSQDLRDEVETYVSVLSQVGIEGIALLSRLFGRLVLVARLEDEGKRRGTRGKKGKAIWI